MNYRRSLLLMAFMAVSPVSAIDEAIPLSKVVEAFHQGDLEQAQKLAKLHLTYESRSVDAKLVAARVSVARRDYAAAVPLLRANVEESPRDFRSWHLLGECLARLGKIEEGVKCLRKALELNPYNGASVLWLAKTTADKNAETALLMKVLVMEERDSSAAKEALRILRSRKKEKQPRR
ncbi:MAG: tetratricopeptide (TPR) repeat protein [Limisphaerales bacterium]|jgi:tetratricopeptide (TPR) repeat protein